MWATLQYRCFQMRVTVGCRIHIEKGPDIVMIMPGASAFSLAMNDNLH